MFPSETDHLRQSLGRDPTETELAVISAEWSEHCSYKSSKRYIRTLPSEAPHVMTGRGLDSGVIDVGGGYVVTAHIESHNHPSAVEPYGGAATGVGGIIRDIISTGTRPIAVLDGLRFGDITVDNHAAWLFRNAVAGISDYGNCMGIPTIGGETGFDESYAGYALVDVAAIGLGKKEELVRNRANPGDSIVLLGGPTGYDGVGGAQFASDALDAQDRSAVQIPDPFMEKMVMEAILEAAPHAKAVKDLGGGGLACAVSETAHSLGVGADIDVDAVHTRNPRMGAPDIMVSESQERMLAVTDGPGLNRIRAICSRFGVPLSVIGEVNDTRRIRVRRGGTILADIPAELVVKAPPLEWPASPPRSQESDDAPPPLPDYSDILASMLGGPGGASRRWIYSQYDHEVGVRTVVRPGGDASMLRLDNGAYLAVSMDGNPGHCHSNPYHGAMGCFEEAHRNVACLGARPVAMLDHLQFGSPEDPRVFWTFQQTVTALRRYALDASIPCIGGKVSLYNETPRGPIKPSPVILVLGLAEQNPRPRPAADGDALFIIGRTANETGGSAYSHVVGHPGGRCPRVDAGASVANADAVRGLVRDGIAKTIHDCSRGGLGVAVSKICMDGKIGCCADVGSLPGNPSGPGTALFSESHSRYLVVAEPAADVAGVLDRSGVPFSRIGMFGGDTIRFVNGGSVAADLMVDKVYEEWSGVLGRSVLNG